MLCSVGRALCPGMSQSASQETLQTSQLPVQSPPRCSDTGEMAVVLLLASLLAAPCTSLRIRRDAACDEVMAAFDTCTEA